MDLAGPGDHIITRTDDKGGQQSGGETTWTNTGATRSGRGQPNTGTLGDSMLRSLPNDGTLRLPDDDDEYSVEHSVYTAN